jgi:nuclear transport factor 2 (NTF2) superfamily protein
VSEHPALRWARVWEQAWRERDPQAIGTLYADDCIFRTHPFREAENPLAYVSRELPNESDVEARFGRPVVDGDRAAVEWWATLLEEGRQITLAGFSWLRFDERGLVLEQRDYWAQRDGRTSPPAPWGG